MRRDLQSVVVGSRIRGVEAAYGRWIRSHGDAQEFHQMLVGAEVTQVGRIGKFLLVSLDGPTQGARTLVAHLGMSGQLRWQAGGWDGADLVKAPAKHVHVVLNLDLGDLLFVDPRTFGQMFVDRLLDRTDPTGSRAAVSPRLMHLGSDGLARKAVLRAQIQKVRGSSRSLKSVLLDQTVIAGIGNIYSDEICFAAGLNPAETICSLGDAQIGALVSSISSVLDDAVKARGSSLADEQYRDLFGQGGSYQLKHKVHAREGEPCLRCRAPIVKTKLAQRGTYFCKSCQCSGA